MALTLASLSHPTASTRAPPLSLRLAWCSSEPGLTGHLRSSVPMRLSGLESSCPMKAPWPQTPTLLLCPSTKSEAIRLEGVVPPISPEGPQAR
jgi:hypothetical protein